MRTLVVHLGGIGDFLLTCPALKLLADEGPVELVGQTERLQLAVEAGIAAAAHDFGHVGFESVFTQPNEDLRGFLSRFDRCIVWIRDDGVIERNLLRCGVADARVFPGLPPKDWSVHASRYYLNCLGMDDAPPFRLPIEPALVSQDVIIHPGSGGEHKNWPLESFISLGEGLEDAGQSVRWCLGPAEEDLALPGKCEILRSDSLAALARELAAARLYVGNDSGVTHLAAAVGCRTVAVFGPTDPRIWSPLGPCVRVVQGAPWPGVAEVLEAVSQCGSLTGEGTAGQEY